MRRLALFCLLALVLASTPAPAQQALLRPQAITFQTLTVSTTAVGLAAGTITPADGKGVVARCVGTVETNPIRMRAAPNSAGVATNPTATIGMPAAVGSVVTIEGYRVVNAWRAIRDTTAVGDATINFECYREFRP